MFSRRRFVALSVLADALLVNAGMVLAFLVRFGGNLPAFNFEAYVVLAPFSTVAYLVSSWAYGLYDPERFEDGWTITRSVTAAMATGTVFVAALAFLGGTRTESLARWTLLLGFAFSMGLLVMWRLMLLAVGGLKWREQRVVLIGTGPVAIELAHELTHRARWGWRVCGLLATSTDGLGDDVDGFPVLGRAADAARIAGEQHANRIIVVSPIALRELIESLVVANELDVRVDVVPELYEIFIGRVDALVGDIPLMKIAESSVPEYYRAVKRALDLVLAITLLVVAAPLLLGGMLAILIEDGRPVVFRQERTGRGLRPFWVYKLRTMVRDAEKLSGPVLAEEDDPRVTRVGRVLRTYRIDELPQLVNILKGEMSFIGPRPERPYFVERFSDEIPGYAERFRVKPGVTGLAQVSGGYATTPERKLKYDLIYLHHQNLAMDAQIIAETLKVVLTGRGSR